MKFRLSLLVALCAVTTVFAESQIKYIQWNIGQFALGRWARPVKPEYEAKRAAEYKAMIDKLKPDIIGICEFRSAFSKETIGRIFADFPVKTVGPSRGWQWNATFSRNLEFVSSNVIDYVGRNQKVYYIDSIYRINGKEVHVVQSHLDWNSCKEGAEYRAGQIKQLIDAFKDKPYVIISADFNTYADAEYDPFVKAGFSLANCAEHGSFLTYQLKPAPKKGDPYSGCIDNIVCKGFKIKDVFVEDKEFRLSDHRILGATLIMR